MNWIMDLQVRPALPSDLALLRAWDAKPHVITARGSDGGMNWEEELSRHPPWRELLIAEISGHAIGFMQIIDPALEDSHYWWRDACRAACNRYLGRQRGGPGPGIRHGDVALSD